MDTVNANNRGSFIPRRASQVLNPSVGPIVFESKSLLLVVFGASTSGSYIIIISHCKYVPSLHKAIVSQRQLDKSLFSRLHSF